LKATTLIAIVKGVVWSHWPRAQCVICRKKHACILRLRSNDKPNASEGR